MTDPGLKITRKNETPEPPATGWRSRLADADAEIARVLQVRRWQMQTAPFTGFRSPPGRF
jgi:hypothetical protein